VAAQVVDALVPSSNRLSRAASTRVRASSTAVPSMKYKVAVVGGGPSGACAADVFAKDKSIDTFFIERKMDNCKPCGGAIPLCMVEEFGVS